jgi:hypothetical protein
MHTADLNVIYLMIYIGCHCCNYIVSSNLVYEILLEGIAADTKQAIFILCTCKCECIVHTMPCFVAFSCSRKNKTQ